MNSFYLYLSITVPVLILAAIGVIYPVAMPYIRISLGVIVVVFITTLSVKANG